MVTYKTDQTDVNLLVVDSLHWSTRKNLHLFCRPRIDNLRCFIVALRQIANHCVSQTSAWPTSGPPNWGAHVLVLGKPQSQPAMDANTKVPKKIR